MLRSKIIRRSALPYASLVLLLIAVALCLATISRAGEPQRNRDSLTEPVYRVANAKIDHETQAQEHPLDPALELARQGLDNIQNNIRDYTCTLVKRERVGGELLDYEYIFTKVRNRKVENGRVVTPFSVYMYFLKPASMKGREVVFVEGANGEKLKAHEGGIQGRFLPSVWLAPDGPLAMRGNRYPITEVGLENLVSQLIERGERDRQRGECEVQFFKDAKINGRSCTLLQVKHPVPRDYFDFHIAQIFIDDELNIPVRYAAYTWPSQAGGKPELLEEYTYLNVKVNVGLSDEDFNPDNPKYNF